MSSPSPFANSTSITNSCGHTPATSWNVRRLTFGLRRASIGPPPITATPCLKQNDRFVEHFYADRWYNIFEIHSVQDDHLKGWYCNIVQPALFSANEIAQVDLALDVWIDPDGAYQVLDQAEFDALPLDADTRQQANAALNTLLDLLAQRAQPFHVIARPA